MYGMGLCHAFSGSLQGSFLMDWGMHITYIQYLILRVSLNLRGWAFAFELSPRKNILGLPLRKCESPRAFCALVWSIDNVGRLGTYCTFSFGRHLSYASP